MWAKFYVMVKAVVDVLRVAVVPVRTTEQHRGASCRHTPAFNWLIVESQVNSTLKSSKMCDKKKGVLRKEGKRLCKTPADDFTVTKKLNVDEKGSGQRSKGSVMEWHTVPLRSADRNISTIKRDFFSKASNAGETTSTIQVQWTSTVLLTNRATTIQGSPRSDVVSIPVADGRIKKHFGTSLNTHGPYLRNEGRVHCYYPRWPVWIENCSNHTGGQKTLDHTEP